MDFKNDKTIEKSQALWYNTHWIIGISLNGTAATLRVSDSPGMKILILFEAIARQNYNLINGIPHPPSVYDADGEAMQVFEVRSEGSCSWLLVTISYGILSGRIK